MAQKLPASDGARRGPLVRVEEKKAPKLFRIAIKILELLSWVISILDGLKNLLGN